jgi:hypothetical protein
MPPPCSASWAVTSATAASMTASTRAIEDWAETHTEQVHKARSQYDNPPRSRAKRYVDPHPMSAPVSRCQAWPTSRSRSVGRNVGPGVGSGPRPGIRRKLCDRTRPYRRGRPTALPCRGRGLPPLRKPLDSGRPALHRLPGAVAVTTSVR